MKQVLQHRKQGDVAVHEVPPPQLQPGGILVRNTASLISAGTERAGIELTQKSMLGMAQERPDLVKRVLDKLQRDGFRATIGAVRDQLDRFVPLGYSCAGVVSARGVNVNEFETGQLVACAGAGYACHAEVNFVPRRLAAVAPPSVSSEQAAYATVGAIALQGIRNARVEMGETVAVIGLGLIGQLAIQLLRAAGCRAIGFDVAEPRARLAREQGALAAFSNSSEEHLAETLQLTRGMGVDAVLITAATSSNAPVELAARIARDRGRVVMVGVTGMDLPRNDYYHKELSLTVSRSYGPGRYDPSYEEQGHDYPAGFVRWTEQRNLQAFLDLAASGAIQPQALTTHRFSISDADAAYELILSGSEPHLGILLEYPAAPVTEPSRIELPALPERQFPDESVGLSLIGVGNFARGVLLKNLKRMPGIRLQGVLSATGHTAATAGRKFGFRFCTSNIEDILRDEETQAVVIATRHAQHADLACRAMEAGKAVFLEKPLAVDLTQLRQLIDTRQATNGRILVGFNRRFAPLTQLLREHFHQSGPLSIRCRVNAGALPPGHWLSAPAEGGRLIGEGCHFIDLFACLIPASPVSVFAASVGTEPDNLQVLLSYGDGSVAELTYCTTAASATPKEEIEVLGGQKTGRLHDFRSLTLETGSRTVLRRRGWRSQDKGHSAELRRFVEAVAAPEPMPIEFDSLVETTLVTFAAIRSAAEGRAVPLSELRAEL